jgi:hypothetical protein
LLIPPHWYRYKVTLVANIHARRIRMHGLQAWICGVQPLPQFPALLCAQLAASSQTLKNGHPPVRHAFSLSFGFTKLGSVGGNYTNSPAGLSFALRLTHHQTMNRRN